MNGFKPALISKGLRPASSSVMSPSSRLQASPDFKGIKTVVEAVDHVEQVLQASPDFKGIKTTRSRQAEVDPASSQP